MGIYTNTCQQRDGLNVTNEIKKQKTAKDICQVNWFEKEHYL